VQGLFEIATSIIGAETRRVEAAAQNIANAATSGYKRQGSFNEVLSQSTQQSTQGALTGDLIPQSRTWTDMTPGKLTATSGKLDFALTGDGFMVVSSPSGPVYTRSGHYTIDERDRVVNEKGWPLRDASGGDLVLRGENWSLESDGTIVDGGTSVGRIAIVGFKSQASLTPTSGGFLSAEVPIEVERVTVKQGFIEQSNSSTADDMVRMMEAVRRAEAGQRLALACDGMLGSALRLIGEGQQ
jgi:flagellar basal-body rod protein FlgF